MELVNEPEVNTETVTKERHSTGEFAPAEDNDNHDNNSHVVPGENVNPAVEEVQAILGSNEETLQQINEIHEDKHEGRFSSKKKSISTGIKSEEIVFMKEKVLEIYKRFPHDYENDLYTMMDGRITLVEGLFPFPMSLNESGSILLTSAHLWIMFMHSTLNIFEDNKNEAFLNLFENATEYVCEDKLVLVDFFVKYVESNFSADEIFQIINLNPKSEKKSNIFEISKNDYKYLIKNSSFFDVLVPRSGKKMRPEEHSPNIKSNTKSGQSSSEVKIKKFEVNIIQPDLEIHNLNIKSEDDEIIHHPYSNAVIIDEDPELPPINEEINENEINASDTFITNFTIDYNVTVKRSVEDLRKEIISKHTLQIFKNEICIDRTLRSLAPKINLQERSSSFDILTKIKSKKRLSFINNYDSSDKENVDKSRKKENHSTSKERKDSDAKYKKNSTKQNKPKQYKVESSSDDEKPNKINDKTSDKENRVTKNKKQDKKKIAESSASEKEDKPVRSKSALHKKDKKSKKSKSKTRKK